MSEQRRPDDRELEEFLAGKDPLSRRYRQAVEREGPPPEIDRAILDRARAELDGEQRVRRRRRAVVPLALAATVVLSFSMFLVMREQPGGLPGPVAVREAAPEKVEKKEAFAADAEREDDAVARQDKAVSQPVDSQVAAMQQEMQLEMQRRQLAPAAAPPAAAEAMAKSAGGLSAAAAPKAEAQGAADEPGNKMRARRNALRDERAASSTQASFERIRKLKEQGEVEEARKQLTALKEAQPDLEIPEDLRTLVRPVTPPTP